MFWSLLRSIWEFFFGCPHRNTTFPLTPVRRNGASHTGMYVACLDCGKELSYDWEEMRVGKPMEDAPAARPVHARPALEVVPARSAWK